MKKNDNSQMTFYNFTFGSLFCQKIQVGLQGISNGETKLITLLNNLINFVEQSY